MIDFGASYGLLIDGKLVSTVTQLDVVNPATGKVVAHCPPAGAAVRGVAVAAARAAFPAWRALSCGERAAYIAHFAAAREAHKEPLARLLTQEQGKPLGHSRDEITRAATLAIGMTKIALEPQVI